MMLRELRFKADTGVKALDHLKNSRMEFVELKGNPMESETVSDRADDEQKRSVIVWTRTCLR